MEPNTDIKMLIPSTQELVSSQDGQILRYVESDESTNLPTGRYVTLLINDFLPLGYNELEDHKLETTNRFPIAWKNARILESAMINIDESSIASGNAIFSSTFATGAVALVRDGWLPAGLILNSETVILPDRCTISDLISRFENGVIRKKMGRDDFLDLILNKKVCINLGLYALEGNIRHNPSPDLIKRQLVETYTKIQAALPLAELVPVSNPHLTGSMRSKQSFLMELAPKLRPPVGRARQETVWKEILAVADKHNVSRSSLVVIAALSTVSVPNGRSPAKQLLKIGPANYTSEDAYNALADLRTLEILICIFALNPEKQVALWTGDKNLALFWTGIRPFDFHHSDRWRCKIAPAPNLFSGISPSLLSEFLEAIT